MGIQERPGRRSHERALLIRDPSRSQAMQVNPRMYREQMLHEAMFVHIQAKESYPLLALCRHMYCNAQGEAHLVCRRRGCDDDQVCTLPSSDEGIEIMQTRGNASHLFPLCVESHASV